MKFREPFLEYELWVRGQFWILQSFSVFFLFIKMSEGEALFYRGISGGLDWWNTCVRKGSSMWRYDGNRVTLDIFWIWLIKCVMERSCEWLWWAEIERWKVRISLPGFMERILIWKIVWNILNEFLFCSWWFPKWCINVTSGGPNFSPYDHVWYGCWCIAAYLFEWFHLIFFFWCHVAYDMMMMFTILLHSSFLFGWIMMDMYWWWYCVMPFTSSIPCWFCLTHLDHVMWGTWTVLWWYEDNIWRMIMDVVVRWKC